MLEVLKERMPVQLKSCSFPEDEVVGLIIVDAVNGFCTVGAGNLAPPVPNPQVERMVAEIDQLASLMTKKGLPVMAFLDTHEPGKPEPPYPPHCEIGTGEENLVEELAWLSDDSHVTLLRKDCINGFVGAIEPAHKGHGTTNNRVVDWANLHGIESLIVTGICTDICVMDFVLTLLSARNHGLTTALKDIIVLEKACSTFDLPKEAAIQAGLPETLAHPQRETHYLGLYFMASRGAVIASGVEFAG